MATEQSKKIAELRVTLKKMVDMSRERADPKWIDRAWKKFITEHPELDGDELHLAWTEQGYNLGLILGQIDVIWSVVGSVLDLSLKHLETHAEEDPTVIADMGKAIVDIQGQLKSMKNLDVLRAILR